MPTGTTRATRSGAVAAGKKIDGLTVGGHGASVRIDMTESFAKLKVAAAFRGLDVGFNDYRAQQVGFDLGFDAGAGQVDVKRFQLEAPGGGRLDLDAQLRIDTLKLQLDARLRDLRTDSYLPPPLRAMGGGRLSGRVVARGDLAAKSVDLRELDFELRRTHAASLPPSVRVHGSARLSPTHVDTSGLSVEIPGANATAKGEMDLDHQLVKAALAVVAFDLGRVLGDLGLAAAGQGRAHRPGGQRHAGHAGGDRGSRHPRPGRRGARPARAQDPLFAARRCRPHRLAVGRGLRRDAARQRRAAPVREDHAPHAAHAAGRAADCRRDR